MHLSGIRHLASAAFQSKVPITRKSSEWKKHENALLDISSKWGQISDFNGSSKLAIVTMNPCTLDNRAAFEMLAAWCAAKRRCWPRSASGGKPMFVSKWLFGLTKFLKCKNCETVFAWSLSQNFQCVILTDLLSPLKFRIVSLKHRYLAELWSKSCLKIGALHFSGWFGRSWIS